MPSTPLEHLSELLGVPLSEDHLPAEILWRGSFELEIVKWGNRIIVTGILAVGIGDEDPLLAEVTRLRSTTFSRPSVILAYQSSERRLIVWTPLGSSSDAADVTARLTDLLAVMESLRPALPSL